MLVENAVQAASFVLVAVDAVLDLFGCIAEEVIGLSLMPPVRPTSLPESSTEALTCIGPTPPLRKNSQLLTS